MVVMIWAAGTLAKRYAPELGSDAVDALFSAVSTANMVSCKRFRMRHTAICRGIVPSLVATVPFESMPNSNALHLGDLKSGFSNGSACVFFFQIGRNRAPLKCLASPYRFPDSRFGIQGKREIVLRREGGDFRRFSHSGRASILRIKLSKSCR